MGILELANDRVIILIEKKTENVFEYFLYRYFAQKFIWSVKV